MKYQLSNMLKIKHDINQQDFKIADLHFVKFEKFSPTWSRESRQRDISSSGWKFKLNNLATKGLSYHIMIPLKLALSTHWPDSNSQK